MGTSPKISSDTGQQMLPANSKHNCIAIHSIVLH